MSGCEASLRYISVTSPKQSVHKTNTVLDIHACPVHKIPEGGTVEFVDQIHLSLAGTAGGTAHTAAKLGMKVHLIAAVGTDSKGQFLLQVMVSPSQLH